MVRAESGKRQAQKVLGGWRKTKRPSACREDGDNACRALLPRTAASYSAHQHRFLPVMQPPPTEKQLKNPGRALIMTWCRFLPIQVSLSQNPVHLLGILNQRGSTGPFLTRLVWGRGVAVTQTQLLVLPRSSLGSEWGPVPLPAMPASTGCPEGRRERGRGTKRPEQGSHLLLGRVKYPCGEGSQHLATVSTIGLQSQRGSEPCRSEPCCTPPPSKHWGPLPRQHSPWLVDDFSQDSDSIVVTHVLKINVVDLGVQRKAAASCSVATRLPPESTLAGTCSRRLCIPCAVRVGTPHPRTGATLCSCSPHL